jgi:phage N-6-adenine-methyltransferase
MNDEWGTPQTLFDLLNAEFAFDLDACATVENAKCKKFITKTDDIFHTFLAVPHVVWMNPPFSRIKDALVWARGEAERGSTVVVLVPTRTNPPWWHDHVMKAEEIRFIKHKVAFEPKKGVGFTGHAIAVFRPERPHKPGCMSQHLNFGPKVSTQLQRKAEGRVSDSKGGRK